MSTEIENKEVTPEMAADYSNNAKIREAAGLIDKAVEMLPDKGYWTKSRAEIDETISYIQDRATVLIAEFKVVEDRIKEASDQHYERIREHLDQFEDKMKALKERSKAIGQINLPNVPYQAEEIAKLAQALESMTPEALERMRHICTDPDSTGSAKGGGE